MEANKNVVAAAAAGTPRSGNSEARMSPLLRLSTWERIRQHFTEDEKMELNGAITGEAICPRGAILDLEKLSPVVLEKLKLHTADEARGRRR